MNKVTFLNLFSISVISILIIFNHGDEINRDGVLYLTQAQFIKDGNIDFALDLYSSPIFGYMIFLIHLLLSIR